MTASKIRGSRRQAARRAAVTAAVAVAASSLPPSAYAMAGDGGDPGWQVVTGFSGSRACRLAGNALWWQGEIGHFSCVPGRGGFYLYVK
ncbi:hypothetical protein [Actinomadura sp. 9N407]|uniref:hypothetical protein n=1 Tax=Actinomadura sp. 9N407 TaxID=3375154 RepID=UPI0037B10210